MNIESSDAIVAAGRSLHGSGLAHGSTGNISVRTNRGWAVTPTGSRLGDLSVASLSILDASWEHVAGEKPTKERYLHKALAERSDNVCAVIHLHSPYAVALSCLPREADPIIPAYTPYFAMKVGTVHRIRYFPPGDQGLARAITDQQRQGKESFLLDNHGPIIARESLTEAMAAIEELEASARLVFILHSSQTSVLTEEQVKSAVDRFG